MVKMFKNGWCHKFTEMSEKGCYFQILDFLLHIASGGCAIFLFLLFLVCLCMCQITGFIYECHIPLEFVQNLCKLLRRNVLEFIMALSLKSHLL